MPVGDNPNLVAAGQIRAVLPCLRPLSVAALFAFDAGYDPVRLSIELGGTPAQIVVRVRTIAPFSRGRSPAETSEAGCDAL